MPSSDQLQQFAEQLGALSQTQPEMATAILWFYDHQTPGVEITASQLGKDLHDLGLANKVNAPRLREQLAKRNEILRGKSAHTVKLSVAGRAKLNEQYLLLLKSPRVSIDDRLVPDAMILGTRPYLEKLAREINGSYQYGFFDGCAALCRRMVESLLIECFDVAGHDSAIKTSDGNYRMLAAIITEAKSGQYIKLSRNAPDALDKVKEVGDRAAHDRYYITQPQDIDAIATQFRALITELMAKAKIQPKPK